MEYRVPLETLDLNKITHLLYNQKTEALIQIRELLRGNDYNSFYDKFMEHPQINNIWRTKTCITKKVEEHQGRQNTITLGNN
jgi:hypothetical protein